jgi:NADPH:quinone reductase
MAPSTEMQALVVERANGPFVMTRMPSPTPGAHQVLVRVVASGVNPLDTKIRAGNAAHARVAFPAVLGLDLAGVVEGVGYEVSDFREGDEVYAMGGGVGGLQGSLATHIAVDVDLLAPKPKNLSLREAAAMPLAVITAWEGLVDRAQVHEGNKVLVFTLLPLLSGNNRRHHGDILRQATALAEAGKLKPLLSAERFRLETALEAHRAVESGKAPGKIVVEIE